MKRGFTPIVTVILLIAIGIVAAVGMYYWVGTLTSKPATPQLPALLSVVPMGNKQVLIANLGNRPINTSELRLSSNATIACTQDELLPGQQIVCIIGNATGTVTIYGPGTGATTVNLGTGDTSPPEIRRITDNHTQVNLYENVGVNTTVTDNTGVSQVTLFYKTPSGVWNAKIMHLSKGDHRYGTWRSKFNLSELGTWEYYITAEDKYGNTKKSEIVKFNEIIAYTNPTPHSGSKVSNFTINVSAVNPSEVTLNFNGTNFTIYGGDEIYCSRGIGPWKCHHSGSSLLKLLSWHCRGRMLKHIGPLNPNGFSLSFWVRYNPILSWGTSSMSVYWSGDDCAGVTLTKTSTQFKAKIGSDNCASNGEIVLNWSKMENQSWHMITVTKNKTSVTFYFDGKPLTTIEVSMNGKSSSGTPIMVSWGGVPFWLQPDEVHVYNYTLSPKQVELLYHMEYGPYYAKMHNLRAGKYTFKVNAKTSLGEGVTEERDVIVQ